MESVDVVPRGEENVPLDKRILVRRHIRLVIEQVSGLKSRKAAPIGWHNAAPIARNPAHFEWGKREGHAVTIAVHRLKSASVEETPTTDGYFTVLR